MLRVLIVLAVIFSRAAVLPADDSADFYGRLESINSKFALWKQQNSTITEGPEFDLAVAERNAALKQLASEAEGATSSDHLTLAELYGLLDRREDAVREAQAVIAAKSVDLESQARILQVMCDLNLPDEALTAFRHWISLDVEADDLATYLTPLGGRSKSVEAMIRLLVGADRKKEARQAYDELNVRLGQLKELSRPLDPTSGLRTKRDEVTMVQVYRIELDRIISPPQVRKPAARPSTPQPPVRRPTVAVRMPPTAPRAPTAPPKRPTATGPRSDGPVPYLIQYVSICRDTHGRDITQAGEYEKFQTEQTDSLNALAAKILADPTGDPLTLALIHHKLGRRDDAVAEVRRFLAKDSVELPEYGPLIELLSDLGLADEVLANFRRWVALDVNPADIGNYLEPIISFRFANAAEEMARVLFQAGRVAEAKESLKLLEDKLAKLLSEAPDEPASPGRHTTREIVREAQQKANGAYRAMTLPKSVPRTPQNAPTGTSTKPPSITAELYRILRNSEVSENGDRERDAGLNALLARALKDQSTDHQGLARLYDALTRPVDVDNELRRAVETCGPDLASRVELTYTFSDVGKMDEALAHFREWVTLDVSSADAPAYLGAMGSAESPLPVKLLLQAERFNDVQQAMTDWETQLNTLQATIDAAPDHALIAPNRISDLQRMIGGILGELREMKFARGVKRVDGRIVFNIPLDLAFEMTLIYRESESVNLNDPEALSISNARRRDALEQLAAAAEAAQSKAHAPLAEIYLQLGRYDKAAHEAKTALEDGDKGLDSYAVLMESLWKSGMQDEALLVFREFQSIDVSESLPPDYLSASRSVAEAIVGSLIDSNRLSEAEQALSEIETQLGRAKLSPRDEISASSLKRTIASLRIDLDSKRK